MNRTTFNKKQTDNKFENINKVEFRSQQHLNKWNQYIMDLDLP